MTTAVERHLNSLPKALTHDLEVILNDNRALLQTVTVLNPYTPLIARLELEFYQDYNDEGYETDLSWSSSIAVADIKGNKKTLTRADIDEDYDYNTLFDVLMDKLPLIRVAEAMGIQDENGSIVLFIVWSNGHTNPVHVFTADGSNWRSGIENDIVVLSDFLPQFNSAVEGK